MWEVWKHDKRVRALQQQITRRARVEHEDEHEPSTSSRSAEQQINMKVAAKHHEYQLDTWHRVEPFKCLNSIPSMDLQDKCTPTRYLVWSWPRYQVSSWGTFVLQLDTWYRVEALTSLSSSGPYGDQYNTWYRVDPCKCLSSRPSIELLLIWGAARYLTSSW